MRNRQKAPAEVKVNVCIVNLSHVLASAEIVPGAFWPYY